MQCSFYLDLVADIRSVEKSTVVTYTVALRCLVVAEDY